MSSQKGFSLIESLIAILVFAVGLLGIAGMQIRGLKNVTSANLISQSSYLAQDMIERMQANPQGITTGAYDRISVDGSETDPECLPDCSHTGIAQTDAYTWGQKIYADLSTGSTGTVSNNGDGTYTIVISWTEVTSLGPESMNYTIRVRQ